MAKDNKTASATKILRAYQNLWIQFSAICKDCQVVAKPFEGNGVSHKILESGNSEFRSFFWLKSCPYRGSKTHKKIDVVVESSEFYDALRETFVKSCVRIGYFSISNSSTQKARCLLSLHYDFEEDVLDGHPIFHAQIDRVAFDKEYCDSVGFNLEILDEVVGDGENEFGKARIPTAHMNLSAILLCLSADHFQADQHKKFLDKVRSSHLCRIQVACTNMTSSIGAGQNSHWHSSHWFK